MRTARRRGGFVKVIGYRRVLFGAVMCEGVAAAPERPNNKKQTVNCKKMLCKKYFIILTSGVEKNVFLRRVFLTR